MPTGLPVYLTVPAERRLRRTDGICVTRRAGFRPEPPGVQVRQGLPVVRLEQALVDSWPLWVGDVARAPLLLASQERRTTPDRVWREAVARPNLEGRAQLLALLGLLRAGCHSELELWGYRYVFDSPLLPPSQAQVPVRLGQRTVYLDRWYVQERVDVELDGAKWHSGDAQRERDLRRDAALAALGIQVVRFSHARLTAGPQDAQLELRDILLARRRQLRVA